MIQLPAEVISLGPISEAFAQMIRGSPQGIQPLDVPEEKSETGYKDGGPN